MSDRQTEGGLRCAVCDKPQVAQFKPFCSKRCAQLDLSRWLKGSYAIPARDEDEGDGVTLPTTGLGEGGEA